MTILSPVQVINVPIVPLAGAGALGVNYAVVFGPPGSTPILASAWQGAIHGTAYGNMTTTKLRVAIHMFGAPTTATTDTAAAIAVFDGTEADLLDGRTPRGGYVLFTTRHYDLDSTAQQEVVAADGTIIQRRVVFGRTESGFRIPCLTSSTARNVVAVAVADDYMHADTLSCLLFDAFATGSIA